MPPFLYFFPVDYPSLAEIRQSVQDSLKTLRQDHKRSLNPTPYKVCIVYCIVLVFFLFVRNDRWFRSEQIQLYRLIYIHDNALPKLKSKKSAFTTLYIHKD